MGSIDLQAVDRVPQVRPPLCLIGRRTIDQARRVVLDTPPSHMNRLVSTRVAGSFARDSRPQPVVAACQLDSCRQCTDPFGQHRPLAQPLGRDRSCDGSSAARIFTRSVSKERVEFERREREARWRGARASGLCLCLCEIYGYVCCAYAYTNCRAAQEGQCSVAGDEEERQGGALCVYVISTLCLCLMLCLCPHCRRARGGGLMLARSRAKRVACLPGNVAAGTGERLSAYLHPLRRMSV